MGKQSGSLSKWVTESARFVAPNVRLQRTVQTDLDRFIWSPFHFFISSGLRRSCIRQIPVKRMMVARAFSGSLFLSYGCGIQFADEINET